jgi:uncharacterized protein YjdB
MKSSATRKIISIALSLLLAISGVLPTLTAFADDGVEGYYDLQIFYDETSTMVPSYGDDGETEYIEYMYEGDELQLTYQLIDSVWPDNGYVKWASSCPTIVDVDDTGKVKAFDSSKGAVVRLWIDNEVGSIPIIGTYLAKLFEKALFNDYVDLDSMDTEEICDLVIATMGSDSFIADYVEAYQGQLVDSLREYLDKVNTDITCKLYDKNDKLVAEDSVSVAVKKSEEWYAAFLPNGTHITNKASINTTQAKGATVQLTAITTPQRLGYGTVYSVKSSSVFSTGKVVATVTDSGLVTFKNTGTVTILVSPDSEDVIEGILKMVNYVYTLDNTGTLDTDKVADILIKYMGVDMNRTVLAGLLDAAFAVYKIAGDSADPVQLTATAVEIIANIVLQMAYNDSITFTVVDAQPLTDFDIEASATSVKEGAQLGLEITNISPDAGDTTDITWSSSDPTIATVDPETGVVTGLDAGGSLGSLSSQTVEITATSAANNVSKTITITVTGKTGKYISSASIVGDDMVDIDSETDYGYAIYPARVAESTNLYTSWGMVTGEDEDGNPVYTWASENEPVTDGIGKIDANGHYTAVDGGTSTIAFMAKTGYYLTDGSFYQISSYTATKDVSTGIPVEKITITCVDGTSNGDKDRDEVITINGVDYEYVTIHKGVGEGYAGNGGVFSATVEPANATDQTLTWVVDNEYYSQSDLSDDTHSVSYKQKAGHEVADTFNIHAVSSDGKVVSNTITVCVTRNYVTANTVDQDTIEVIRGQTADVTHTLEFDGSWTGTAYACYKANWYSSDEGIFSVETKTNDNRDGTVTGNDVGTATLYCVSADGGIIGTATVVVKPDKTYLREIVELCDNSNIIQTDENKALYKQYMRKLDLAYTVLYDEDMASQTTCDTYAQNLLTYFYKLGGFVGVNSVDILGTNKTALKSDYVTVNVGSTTNYTKYSYDFDYAVNPKTAMYSDIKWSSSNSSISVDKNGKCTPTSNDACTATITLTITDYMGSVVSDSVNIAFARTAATGVTLDTSSIVGGKVGDTQTLTPTISPTNVFGNSTASCSDVSWFSNDEYVASVDENGVVTFNHGGNCTITCTTLDGGYIASCYVNVVTNYDNLQLLITQYTDLQLNEINFYPDTWEVYSAAMEEAQVMIEKGGYSQVEVDAMYDKLESAYNGLKKFVYIQNVELYLDGEQTAEFYQYDLSLLKEGISYKNASLDLNVRLYPNNASYESATWESSTSDISVTTAGVCSPTSNKCCYGMITCTVTDAFGNEFSDSVWVSFSYNPVTAVKLSDDNINGVIGDTYQMSATIEPTGSSLLHIASASITDYYWESDDENVATVDENGLVTFTGAGSTTIRAVSYDGGVKGECAVSTEGDRSALKAALEKYKDIDYTQYEYSYGQAFLKAYNSANDALTDLSMKQEDIDSATDNLNSAGEALTEHPYVQVESITIDYTTYKESLTGKATQVSSGSIGSSNAVSINLASNYSNYNNYNYIELNASAYPTTSMYKTITMNVVDSSNMDIEDSSSSYVKLSPSSTGDGGWAKVEFTTTDYYNRTTTRTVYVTMSDKTCTGITVSPTNLSMSALDSSYHLSKSVSGSPEFDTILWSSSNESVATVKDGVVTPVDKGVATITARTLDGGYMANVTVNVFTEFGELAEKVSTYATLINDSTDQYIYTQDSLDTLESVVTTGKQMVDDGSATQAEVNAMVETIDAAYNALVPYVAVDGVSITYEENSNVTVPNEGYIRYTGTTLNSKTIQLVANLSPDDSAIYSSLEWTSSNSDVTVDSFGLVTNTSATSKYSVITCTVTDDNGVEYSASVTVSFVRYPVTAVTFDDDIIYGAPQEVKQLTVNLNQSNTTINSSHINDCTYSSDNEDVATVDSNGNVTFVSQGTATITVTAMDGGFVGTILAYTTWDTTALQEAINQAESITYTDYSYDKGMQFKTALENAKAVYSNIYSTQSEIDEACANLTTAMTELEGNEFIPATPVITVNSTEIGDGLSFSVDDNKQAIITASVNDDAMIKSTAWSYDNANGATAKINGNSIVVTKTADDKASITVTFTVTDVYDRVEEYTYSINIVNQIINITSIDLTINSEVVTDTKYAKTGYAYGYSDFEGLQLGYVATPENATPATSVKWSSSAPNYMTVSDDGLVALTTAGKIRSSNTATITCTVTNADGSTITKTIEITIGR